MADVAMPRLSDSMEEGTIVKWLKSDGDEVRRGEEIVEIETDKANMTYEADDDGVLSIVAGEGDTLAVGELIARIGAPSSDGGGGDDEHDEEEPEAREQDAGAAEEAKASEPGDEEPEAREQDDGEAPEGREGEGDEPEQAPAEDGGAAAAPREDGRGGEDGGDRLKVSPVARRLAREADVELDGLTGSGPGGRIVKADVEAAAAKAPPEAAGDREAERQERPAAAPATAKGETTVQELSRVQQLVARRMAESKATAPDFHLTVEVDMEAAVELRKQLKAADPEAVSPSFNDFVVKAAALALRDVPRANGAYRDGRFELYSRVNVGIAVAGEDALVVPTIFDADRKSLGEIAREARTLAERVREGKITPPELSGGTFTVSNLGMYGIRRFVAVINPPQAAILSVGALEPRAVVRDGEVVARATMDLTLACDHRILYGAEAAQFRARIRERLERPLMLAL